MQPRSRSRIVGHFEIGVACIFDWFIFLFLLFFSFNKGIYKSKTSAPTPEPVPQRVEDKVLLTRSTVLARWGLRAYG